MSLPTVFIRNTTPSISGLFFLYPTQMNVDNQTHKVNGVKMVPTIHNYLFVQHHFHRKNPIIHINSRRRYANTKITSPYYMNYSYIIQSTYCESTLQNFDPIKYYFLFLPLYAKTNRPVLVPIESLQCVDGEFTKCKYGHTFNLPYRYCMTNKLDNREPSAQEKQSLNHLLALQPHSNADRFACALASCNARDQEFLEFFRNPDNWAPDFEFVYRR